MAKRPKQSIAVIIQVASSDRTGRRFQVVAASNITVPLVGDVIYQSDIDRLISYGVTVNIKEAK